MVGAQATWTGEADLVCYITLSVYSITSPKQERSGLRLRLQTEYGLKMEGKMNKQRPGHSLGCPVTNSGAGLLAGGSRACIMLLSPFTHPIPLQVGARLTLPLCKEKGGLHIPFWLGTIYF